jgi:L-ascorbate metabolism protein UlaG (beta-lactamase superfamily)
MKKISILALVLCLASVAVAQPSTDLIDTKAGPLSIRPILHGSFVMSWNGKTIYVDPYGGAKAFEGVDAPDLILITDIHGDHLNPETLNVIETSKAKLVVPQAVKDELPDNLKNKAVVLANGNKANVAGVSISAIPMYNLPETEDSRHPKGRGNGYILNLGGKMVYISGDTEDIPEMKALKNIDVAFICMNQPYTMDIGQASSAVLEFKPKVVYPYHYRGQNGLSDVEQFKKLVTSVNSAIDVRLRNWYPE